jgi:hypothetical protein
VRGIVAVSPAVTALLSVVTAFPLSRAIRLRALGFKLSPPFGRGSFTT